MTQTIEMLDGRIYTSTDGWHTIWLKGRRRPVAKAEADLVRFLAAMGAAR
jgi:hypothetical protein